ncbi:MAG: hypothetical protein K2X71_27175 [Methylobacterium sp.]|uniref:hypothetical protein n=1 Tax=Methylobacterium sp. TaxID=409 RepID=UPI002589FBE8|nr:hypothetical protein [Methylobacterium sp.]MBY0299674.1 hypothetical protein [Methylobacterium sp.]
MTVMAYPCEPVLMLLRTADEAVPRLAGLLKAKGYGVLSVIGTGMSPILTMPGIGLPVLDLALVSGALRRSPALPGIAARLRGAWPGLPIVALPDGPLAVREAASPYQGCPDLAAGASLDDLCAHLDAVMLAAAERRSALVRHTIRRACGPPRHAAF